MNEQVIILVNQMIVFAVLLLIGAGALKIKLLNKTILDSVAKLIINIILPCMLFSTMLGTATRETLLRGFGFFLASICTLLGLYAMSMLTVKLTGLKEDVTRRVFQAENVFGNMGFMGLPLVMALFGETGLFYVAFFILADNLCIWTLGVYLTSEVAPKGIKSGLKRLINPNVIALWLGILLVLIGIKPEGLVFETIKALGNTTKYISMVYLGGALAMISIKSLPRFKSALLIIPFKMLLAPIIVYSVMTFIGLFTYEAIITITIVAALPANSSIVMFANLFGGDGEYAGGAVLMTTLVSMISIPFVVYLVGLLPY